MAEPRRIHHAITPQVIYISAKTNMIKTQTRETSIFHMKFVPPEIFPLSSLVTAALTWFSIILSISVSFKLENLSRIS